MRSIDIVKEVANISTKYEQITSEKKKQFIIRDILLTDLAFKNTSVHEGTFGTGFPFYVIGENLQGNLTVINEQIRYNNELLQAVEDSCLDEWPCKDCLLNNYSQMPNLKFRCKPCNKIPTELKPRKVINRLPDSDLWFVVQDHKLETAKSELLKEFEKYDLYPSDIDPFKTIGDLRTIADELDSDAIPKKHLPLDVHIIEEASIDSLIESAPKAIDSGNLDLRIYPTSYRKTWDYDDVGYNFIQDFLGSFSDISLNATTKEKLYKARHYLATKYSDDELYEIFKMTAEASTLRRHQTPELKETFYQKVKSWQK